MIRIYNNNTGGHFGWFSPPFPLLTIIPNKHQLFYIDIKETEGVLIRIRVQMNYSSIN